MSQVIEVVERYIIPDFPNIDLPEEDGVPLETNWHRLQINLLDDIIRYRWRERTDFFAGGNMFIYYSLQQARNRDYRGPDFFVVKDIDGSYPRQKWVVWEENGRYPDIIVELMSPSTAQEDLGNKKELYERTFHTPEYFCYDPDERKLYGWRLGEQGYTSLAPNDEGRLWSAQLDGWIGPWEGTYHEEQAIWLRLFEKEGQLSPTEAEAERQRAEAERQRAEAAEAELARLRQELARRQGGSEEA
jgi:Uma2 family endonuclease